MLGCFVGAPDTAARGVPDRFLGKAPTVTSGESTGASTDETVKKNGPGGSTEEPMEVDS